MIDEPVVKLVLDNNDKLAFYTTEREAQLLLDVVEEIDNMVTDCLENDHISQLVSHIACSSCKFPK